MAGNGVTRRPTERPSRAVILGTIAFVVAVPGTVVVATPYWLTGWRPGPPLLGSELTRWLGAALIAAGLPLFLDFVVRFVREGLGTPAPIAPTRHLVVGGPYRLVRNPGYVAVLALLIGQALVLGRTSLLVYAAAVAVGFHLFVVLYEEPTLRRSFGPEFETYSRTVPRWIPRLPWSRRALDDRRRD
jgi:protein-S-isoprenylcysteine O-methyltransferase Ste14